ncbi:MAG TPA: APC family permease [Syntrophobacteraceae bacterium]|nr:APC family permease [Syntrophobacteraceae bacterium]
MAREGEMKKTLGLTGVTVNAMALIAPGAFLWLTYQVQSAQVDLGGATTAMDMFAGLFVALILAFLTAVSYSKLAELYPEAGTGSSYYFAEQAILKEEKLSAFARLSKFVVGWFSHLYYWVYPGVMVAMMATLIVYIFQQFGIELSAFWQIATAVLFAFGVGYIAYRGITGSTISSIVINIIQIIALVVVTILALVYRFTNPEHVEFVHPTLSSVVMPHSFANVMFQATVAILLLVGFESATALTAESKSHRHVSRGVIISLIIQGLIMYLFEYFGANAWINTAYTGKDAKGAVVTGIDAAAASSAPIGDMVQNLGNVLLGNMGFALMIIVAITVTIAVVGTTLACVNTGVRVTYAMSKDKEMPSFLGFLHAKHATPHAGILAMSIASAAIGAFGVLSVVNLTAITFWSNIGTFILYGMTNLIALVAFLRHHQRNALTHVVVPVLGAFANLAMLVAVLYLGIAGGGDTQTAAMWSIVATAVWLAIGVVYLLIQSAKTRRKIIGVPT